jgi:leader peptidase (prepilin peptidase) / N-methyltransferase
MPGQPPAWLLAVIGAAAGLAAGPYLAALAAWVPAGSGLRQPPWRCPACRTSLGAAAIPLLGWRLTGGRCAACSARTGSWYAAVEPAAAIVFALMALRFGISPALPAFWLLAALAVVLTVTDLRHRRLPDRLTLPAYPAAVALLGAAALAVPGGARRLAAALAGLAAAGLFAGLLALVSRAGLGWGDVKLGGLLGLYLGWVGAVAVAAGLACAFVLAAVTGLALIAAGRATRKSQLPFGPFLLVSAIAVIALSGLVPVLTR